MTPVVDLARSGAATELVDALCAHGHAAVLGHGVGPDVIAEMRTTSREFFLLPRAEKALVEFDGVGHWRGWQPVMEGSARYGGHERPTELLERLEQNLCPSQGGAAASGNRWPTRPTGLRAAWCAYHDAVFALTARLMTALADALGTDDPDLDAWCGDQWSNLVVNHFPPLDAAPEPDRVRVAPHTDHGGLTVLCADDAPADDATADNAPADNAPGGLEVRDDRGGWSAVGQPDGALLVQAGDLLERWSGGRLRATPHRVVNPPTGLGEASRRLSIVYFHQPRLDFVVVPVTGDRDAYPAVAAGDHVTSRQEAYRRGEPSFD